MNLSVIKTVPSEALNWRFFAAIWVIGILGAARGLDEGIVSSQTKQKAFISSYGIQYGSSMQSNVTSMAQLAGVAGCVIAWFVADRLGRLRACQLACLLWALGSAIWMSSAGNVGQLLAGRFISGLGVGGTVVASPTFIVEISPKSIRGACNSVFSGTVYIGILLGYSANLGVSRHLAPTNNGQFIIPTSLNLMFATITFIGSFFLKETPRWLLSKGRDEDAEKSLVWYRQLPSDHSFVYQELDAMREAIRAEIDAKGENWKWWHAWRSMFTNRNNLYILSLVVGLQLLGQFSGGGSITIYAPELFRIISGHSQDTSLVTTVAFGVVKLVASLAAGLFLLDLLGRKRAAMIGLTLQTIASFYLAGFLFKYPPEEVGAVATSATERRAGVAGVAFIFISGIGWAVGVNAVQYLLASESFDVSVRALGGMLAMQSHFLFQYGSSRTVNPIIDAWGPGGLFAFFGSVTVFVFLLAIFLLPETAGMPLEQMHELFEKPWYKIGLSSWKPYRGKVQNRYEPDEMAYSQEPQQQQQRYMGADLDKDNKDNSDVLKIENRDLEAREAK